jgi:hypothetical protein
VVLEILRHNDEAKASPISLDHRKERFWSTDAGCPASEGRGIEDISLEIGFRDEESLILLSTVSGFCVTEMGSGIYSLMWLESSKSQRDARAKAWR